MSGESVERTANAVAQDYIEGGVQWAFFTREVECTSTFKQDLAEAIELSKREINLQSGPGFPYRLLYRTNKALFEGAWEEVRDRVEERVINILFGGDDFEFCSNHPEEWIERRLRDPDRVFPKAQANPSRKVDPRIIANQSIVDQLVTRVLLGNFTHAEGKAYPKLPTKKGLGFSREHAGLIGACYSANSPKGLAIASDVAGWEKNFTQCFADGTAQVALKTCNNRTVLADRAIDWWRLSLLTNLYILDNGSLIDFADHRVQRSGNLLTTTANGIGRSMAAYCVGSCPMTMGDDCLEWTTLSKEDLLGEYSKIRLPVRDVAVMSKDSFLFCSHRFNKGQDGIWVSWLETWERMLFESSYSKLNDNSTNLNWEDEISEMPDGVERSSIIEYLSSRREILQSRATARAHEEC